MPQDSQIANLLQEALGLLNRVVPIWLDQKDALAHKQIIYAVDVDVVLMHADPRANASYGATFSAAGDVAPLLAALLGEYIFHQPFDALRPRAHSGSDKDQLLMFPQHLAEFRGKAFAFGIEAADSAERLYESTAREQVIEDLSTLRKPITAEKFEKFMAERASESTQVIIGHSDLDSRVAQLERIEKTLGTLETHEGVAELARSQGLKSGEGSELANRARDLFTDMRKLSPTFASGRDRNLDKDANVLAQLEKLNKAASARGIRIVLITGTERLFEVTAKAPAFHPGFSSFAEAYLRDPRAFMGLKDFFAPPARGNVALPSFEMWDWLFLLLPKLMLKVSRRLQGADYREPGSTGTPYSPADLTEELKTFDTFQKDRGRDLTIALEQWQRVVRDVHLSAALSRTRNDAVKNLESLIELDRPELERQLNELMRRVARRTSDSYAALYRATGVIGIVDLLEKSALIRGLPALRFDRERFPLAQGLYDEISDALYRPDRPSTIDMRSLFNRLARFEGSDYHAHLLLAYVYASTGEWRPAKALCRSALVVALASTPSDNAVPFGREANYFLSVAERRLARDETDLFKALEALRRARVLDRRERFLTDRLHDSDSLAFRREDVRFESEELAHDMAFWQFRYFGKGYYDGDGLRNMVSRARTLCEGLAASQEPRGIRAWIMRQAATNGLVAALLSLVPGKRRTDLVGDARWLANVMSEEFLVPRLESDEARPEPQYRDDVSDFVWLVALVMFDKDRNGEARIALKDYPAPRAGAETIAFEVQRFAVFSRLAGLQ